MEQVLYSCGSLYKLAPGIIGSFLKLSTHHNRLFKCKGLSELYQAHSKVHLRFAVVAYEKFLYIHLYHSYTM